MNSLNKVGYHPGSLAHDQPCAHLKSLVSKEVDVIKILIHKPKAICLVPALRKNEDHVVLTADSNLVPCGLRSHALHSSSMPFPVSKVNGAAVVQLQALPRSRRIFQAEQLHKLLVG